MDQTIVLLHGEIKSPPLSEESRPWAGFLLPRRMTQNQLARLIHSSQPRVAMLERGRPEASLDLISRALFALGMSRKEL